MSAEREDEATAAEFWRDQLDGCSGMLELPADRPGRHGVPGDAHAFDVGQDITAAVHAYASDKGTTPGVIMLAVLQVQLYRYTGSRDFLIGLLAAGNADPALPIRSVVGDGDSFTELVCRTGRTVTAALAHRDGDRACAPACQAGFTYSPWPGIRDGEEPAVWPAPDQEFLLQLTETADRLEARLTFAAELFDRPTIERLAEHYVTLAGRLVRHPGLPVADIEFLSSRERGLMAAWNATSTSYPRNCSLVELFTEQVRAAPDAAALTYGQFTLTYRQLDRVTSSLAARLREHAVRDGAVAAMHIGRDPCAVVAMIAIIKAGGAYLPLDPAHPRARLRIIAAEAGPRVVVSEDSPDDSLGLGLPVIVVRDHLGADVRDDSAYDTPVSGGSGPQDLAYVMYTSGSSGTPKGICVSHRNIIRLVKETNYAAFKPGDRMAQVSTPAFDAATFEVWGALLNGLELVGFDRATLISPSRLRTALRERHIDMMVLSTPLFNQMAAGMPDIFAGVSQLLVGGDVMGVTQALDVIALPGCTLVNGYGPTESTTFATAYPVTRALARRKRVPIGGPIANTTCYILDDNLRLQPIGIAGQLYVGGDGVGLGYLARFGLTAERFLPDPFAAEPGTRMYATGDLARWLPDGSIEFIGRADFQVKIRGYRVEPAEVDAALLGYEEIAEAATVVTGGDSEDKALVSYYSTAGSQRADPREVMAFLSERIPDYMLPQQLIELPALPKNANQKIDRSQLSATAMTALPGEGASGHEGGNTIEAEVGAIFSQLLGVPVTKDENFFEIGGHSLLANRLVVRVRERFQVDMSLEELFDDSTVRGVTACIRAHGVPG